MSWNYGHRDDDFDYEKDLDIDVDIDVDLSFDPDLDYTSDLNIDYDIDTDLCFEGNSALLNLDVEAIGKDTLVEVSASVLTTENLSSVTVSAFSAVA